MVKAKSIFPIETFKNIAVGKVSVLNFVAPASIRVAPNSPKALAQPNMMPAMIPFLAMGKRTLKKLSSFEHPKLWAIYSYFISMLSKIALEVLMIKGVAIKN